MLEKAISWIKDNTVPDQGIVISSRNKVCYPEVTGYLIGTLLSVGQRRLAQQYAQWLVSVQQNDGSFGLRDLSYAFDTGQVVRGWVSMLTKMPQLEHPLRRACDWLVSTADSSSGRLIVPPRSADWSLGTRGQVNEGIHLYVLQPLRRAGELLNEPRYGRFADKSLDYYLKNANLTDFTQPNALTHFYAYIQEALLELGCEDKARHGMASVARFQQPTGAVPGYGDVNWVCSPGLAQLAIVWYLLGETERADSALAFLEMLQNSTGGFCGSYGPGADYKPAEEISWAAKYAVEAAQKQIAAHFDRTSGIYSAQIAETDGRVQAVLRQLGDLNAKRLLDAGCGKGRYAAIIKRHYPRADVTGMDISAEMLKCVPPGIHTVQHGILNMPFENGRFDAVICIEALEHVVRIAEGVKELTRVLAPGGKLIVIDKNKEKLGTLKMPSWEKWFAPQELLELMRANGLYAAAELISYGNATEPDGLFVCWTGQKPASCTTSASLVTKPDRKPRRLAVVPSDPLDAYAHKSDEYLTDYFNPTGFFDEVYCLSPLEESAGVKHGMHVIPTGPEQFAQRIKQLEIDIVRAYGGYRACDLACQNKVDTVPVVVSVHDKREDWLHDSIRNADYVLSVSNAVRQLLLGKGIPSERIYDFANRVDLQAFHPCSDDRLRAEFCDSYPGKYRILHVGRRAPEKNLDTLIRAMAALHSDYVCISVGTGDDTEYRKLALQCGVSRRCYFVGSVPHAQLPQYYSFCDCMCTPSRSEGFGLVFIEALVCEAVVVTSNVAPMNEYITNGVSGILVKDFENPAAVAEALTKACTDQQLRSTIRSNARKAAEPFSKDKIDLLEANLYRQFLGDRAPTTKVSVQVRDNIMANNPWYVGSQFEWAEKPAIKRIYDKRYNFFIDCISRAKERLGGKIRLLDAGCGDGYWLWRLRGLQQIELTGIDYNPLRLERARQVVPDVAVFHSDLMDFRADEPFDVVLLSQVVEHVQDDVELLKKIRTLLRDDGTLIVGTTNEGSHLHQEKIMRLGDKFVTDHVHFYTEQEIVSKLHQAGFTVDNIMREAFYLGDDALYYNLLETEWGFELLELLTFLVPSGCSDYYFECNPRTATNSSENNTFRLQPPAVEEIIPKVNTFGQQIRASITG